MKIMHLLPSLSSGGVEQVVLELCQGLEPLGVGNVVVSAGGSLVAAIEKTGARHITMRIGRKSVRTLFLIRKLASVIGKERPHILHLHSRVPAWVGLLACKRLPQNVRPAIVTTFHGFHSVNFYSSVMAKGERIIAVSRCMKEHILANYPSTQANRVIVIPNSVDTSQHYPEYRPDNIWLEQWEREHPELSNRYTLCLPGRITRLKGAEHLVPILKGLHKRNIPAHAVIVGEVKKGKEAYKKELLALFEKEGLGSFITWVGYRRDLRDILCACCVTLSLTLQPESFGKTTLDALSLGRPVAGYEHGGVGEQLDVFLPEGKVPTGNTEAMVQKLAAWYAQAPAPRLPVPPPYRREDMISAHLDLYRELRPQE